MSNSGPAESEPPLYRPCVGIMLLNPAGEAFVGRRIGMPIGLSAWQMPQGGIDPGETPREAALRELAEEVGTAKAEIIAETAEWYQYDLPPEMGGGPWGGRFRGQRQKWFAMRFTGTDADIDLATGHPEFDAWQWVAPSRLPELIVWFKRAVYEAVLKEFGPVIARSAATKLPKPSPSMGEGVGGGDGRDRTDSASEITPSLPSPIEGEG